MLNRMYIAWIISKSLLTVCVIISLGSLFGSVAFSQIGVGDCSNLPPRCSDSLCSGIPSSCNVECSLGLGS